ncbi:MAG: hypothetical protein M3O46_07125 [Myxococcota bacterium]|nr:hypothetical protein [Myxococcota bacterium]
MTQGNLELAQIVVSWVVTLPAVAWIIVRDERRLRGDQLARAWPPQSRDATIFGLWNLGVHPLCVLLHFARTRRGYAGVDMGLLALAVVLVADYCAQLGVEAAVDWLGW